MYLSRLPAVWSIDGDEEATRFGIEIGASDFQHFHMFRAVGLQK